MNLATTNSQMSMCTIYGDVFSEFQSQMFGVCIIHERVLYTTNNGKMSVSKPAWDISKAK